MVADSGCDDPIEPSGCGHRVAHGFDGSVTDYSAEENPIARRQVIKSAIVLSNATANVEIMGKTMKVAEAIELKSTLSFRQGYLATLRNQFTQATQLADKANSDLDKVIETLLTTSYGNDKTKIDGDTVKAITDPQKLQKDMDPSSR